MVRVREALAAAVLVAMVSACGVERVERVEGGVAEGMVVDSLVPADQALERFRRDLAVAPERLTGGLGSPEAVAERIAALLAARDTAGFEQLAIDRAEFAYLVYESHPLAQPPYELPPALMWFQIQQQNRTAVFRLLREFGGRDLRPLTLECPHAAEDHGENRLLGGCLVHLPDGGTTRLFGALLQRDGMWKVVSYAGDL